IVSWALIVDKWWQFRRVRGQTIAFLRTFREGRRPSIVVSAAKKLRESPLAQLYVAAHQEVSGIAEVVDHVLEDNEEGLGGERLDAVHRAMRRSAALEIARLERYLPFLATTASATPFIGLFGTECGGSGRRGGPSLAEINIIPLVDVVLVLLLIFMLTAPMMYRGIDVNLPKAASKPTAVEERMILTVTKDRALYLNDKPVALAT